jgi:hypothetical protein
MCGRQRSRWRVRRVTGGFPPRSRQTLPPTPPAPSQRWMRDTQQRVRRGSGGCGHVMACPRSRRLVLTRQFRVPGSPCLTLRQLTTGPRTRSTGGWTSLDGGGSPLVHERRSRTSSGYLRALCLVCTPHQILGVGEDFSYPIRDRILPKCSVLAPRAERIGCDCLSIRVRLVA